VCFHYCGNELKKGVLKGFHVFLGHLELRSQKEEKEVKTRATRTIKERDRRGRKGVGNFSMQRRRYKTSGTLPRPSS